MMKDVAIGYVLSVKSWKICHYNLLIAWGGQHVTDIDN